MKIYQPNEVVISDYFKTFSTDFELFGFLDCSTIENSSIYFTCSSAKNAETNKLVNVLPIFLNKCQTAFEFNRDIDVLLKHDEEFLNKLAVLKYHYIDLAIHEASSTYRKGLSKQRKLELISKLENGDNYDYSKVKNKLINDSYPFIIFLKGNDDISSGLRFKTEEDRSFALEFLDDIILDKDTPLLFWN